MSRSFREPVVKANATGKTKKMLDRKIRRATKNSFRSQVLDEELELPNPKTLVNDYDYLEYVDHNAGEQYSRK